MLLRERKYRLPEVVDHPLRQPTTHRLLFDCRPCLFEVLFLVLPFHSIYPSIWPDVMCGLVFKMLISCDETDNFPSSKQIYLAHENSHYTWYQ